MKDQKERTLDASQCIHCKKCQKNCAFLSKYKIDIGDTEQLNELAYHCFLCGKCTEVCPVGIDGREIIVNMRRAQAASDQSAHVNKRYKRTINEKLDYAYRNYRHATSKSVFFPGCNFPSVYPKTTKKLAALLEERGIGIVYDCCGKPIGELGMKEQEAKIIASMEARFAKEGITEIVTACPNCYDYLTPRLSIRVTNIYQKLRELGIGNQIPGGGMMYRPCPDRYKGEWMEDIRPFLEKDCETITDVQCCGLGGLAGVEEPELAKGFPSKLKECPERIYVYCGSCAGQLVRNGCKQVQHVLPEIMGTHEKPDTVKSLLNRMRTKYL